MTFEIDLTASDDDRKAVRVETFYSRSDRVWISRLVDADGSQVGDSMEDGTKADAARSAEYLAKQIEA